MSTAHRLSVTVRSTLAVVAVAAFTLYGAAQGSESHRQPEPEATIEIYAAAAWYRTRPEPEETWQGMLEKLDPVIGPAGRTTLVYALRTPDRRLPIYAAGVQDRLAPFVRRSVMVVGKLVDPSGQGLGQELWIATIHPLAEEGSSRRK